MSQDFIQEEAGKHSDILSEVKEVLSHGLPDGNYTPQELNNAGNLLSATGGTIAGIKYLKMKSLMV
jgi:hypothetical protein